MKRPAPSDVFFALFAGAAGRAAVFELKARVFVDAVPDLSGSLTSKLDYLLKDLTEWMAREKLATLEQVEMLRRCGRLRNKVFHAEFSRATGQLVSLDVELNRESVKRFSWDGPVTAENFLRSMATGGEAVSKTATEEKRVFGWLMQACQSGAFGAAGRVFDDGCELLDQVLYDWTDRKIAEDEAAEAADPKD